jgi:hypothetical protein
VKALSATLLAAQKSSSARPYVQAVLRDYYGEGFRLRFRRWYTGSETDSPIACAAAADRWFIRVRNTGGTLYASRVTAPDASSTYSNWSSIGTAFSNTDVALVRMPDGDLCLLYVDTDHTTLKRRISTDDGATWSAASTAISTGSNKDYIAAAVNDHGEVVLFWNEGAAVYTSRWDGSVWGTRTAWSHTAASISGLAVQHSGDFQVIVTGTESVTDNPKVWAVRYGDGFAATPGSWSALRALAEASDGAGVSFSYPSLVLFGGLWRLLYVETFTGDAAYKREQYTTKPVLFDFNTDQWREAIAFDYEGNAFGLAADALTPASLALASSDGVWNATLVDSLDISADVTEASVECDTTGTRVRVELDNGDGRYSAYGAADLAVLRRGARLELSPGYVTSAGNEVNTTRPYAYWVESLELLTGARPRLVLHCRGAEWLLQRWRARHQYVFAAGTVPLFGLLFTMAARAGISYTASGTNSAAYSALEPAYTLHPGETGLTAMRRLIDKVPDVLIFDAGVAIATEPRDMDTSQYAFGPDGHTIVEARYRDTGPAVNRARAVGDGVFGEAFDFDDIEALGESIGDAVDANLTDAADATDRAAALLRDAALTTRSDSITVFGVHCGIELYDVIDVTDAAAGLAATPRRVLGYTWRFSTGTKPRYDMTLTLSAV